jgi:CrcB protein
MGKNILMVGIGGMGGSIARFLMSTYITRLWLSPFPYGTFIVNVSGCFIIGLLYGLSVRYSWFTAD